MSTAPPARRRLGLAARLLAGIAVVVVIGGLTAAVVAGVVGPAVFHRHMLEAGVGSDPVAVMHAEAAFRSAGTLSLTIALVAAVLASLAVSVALTRRVARSLASLSAAAARVARGTFDAAVPNPHLGAEFDELTEALNSMTARLHDSELLRRRLLADVAHELRTPVATLGAYLEGLEDGVAQLTPQTVAILRSQSSRLALLARDLVAVTQAESHDLVLDRARIAPGELLDAAALAVGERFASRGVHLTVDVRADVPRVLVDRDRMAQVLGNLLDNALRHTPTGGTVTLRAQRADTERADRDRVLIVVEDTGEGIDPEHLPHIFERFYRVDTARDRQHGGSGIGLAITRALVEAHDGTIAATSAGRGHGSRFEIRLPVTHVES